MWYYTLNGQQAGPVSQAELARLLNSELPFSTLVWKEGMADWLPSNEVEAFRNLDQAATTVPPIPVPTPQSTNPYSAPQSAVPLQPTGGVYHFPQVKKSSYGLLIGVMSFALIAAISLITIFIVNVISVAESSEDYAAAQFATEQTEQTEFVHNHLEEHHGSDHGSPAELDETFTDEERSTYSEEELAELENFGNEQLKAMFSPGLILSFLICIGACIWGTVLGAIYVYRAWLVLQPSGTTTATPGKAAGFLFIPLFNYYWTFIAYWKWAEEWNQVRRNHSSLTDAPEASEGSFLAMAICQCASLVFSLAGLGQIVLYFVGMKSMCNVINYAADKQPEANQAQLS